MPWSVRPFWTGKKKSPSTYEAQMARLAAEGDGYALYRLGERHWRAGHKRRAIRYYRQSAEAGYAEAASRLGHVLDARDAQERQLWLERAAELAIEQKMPATTVARFLRNIKQFDRADAVLREAADAGDGRAAFSLGLEMRGRGDREAAEAERYLRLAADAGHFDAQTTLGRILMESGRREEGGRYFRLAVDQERYASRGAALELGRFEWKFGHHQEAEHYLKAAATPDAPRSNALAYAEFLYERGRAVQAAELMHARYDYAATEDELREAADMLRRARRPSEAAAYDGRADGIRLMDAVDTPFD